MRRDDHPLNLVTHRRVGRRRILQSGGVVAASVVTAGEHRPLAPWLPAPRPNLVRSGSIGCPGPRQSRWMTTRLPPSPIMRSPHCGPWLDGWFPSTTWVPAPTKRAFTSSSDRGPAPILPPSRCTRHCFPQPAAITTVPYDGRPECSYCGYCSGFGCWNNS